MNLSFLLWLHLFVLRQVFVIVLAVVDEFHVCLKELLFQLLVVRVSLYFCVFLLIEFILNVRCNLPGLYILVGVLVLYCRFNQRKCFGKFLEIRLVTSIFFVRNGGLIDNLRFFESGFCLFLSLFLCLQGFLVLCVSRGEKEKADHHQN